MATSGAFAKHLAMLTAILEEHCGDRTGVFETFEPLVQVFRLTQSQVKQPTLYEPSIVFLASGRKSSYAGQQRFVFDPNTYLYVGGNLPLDCEYDATPSHPIQGAIVKLDIVNLQRVHNAIGADSVVEPALAKTHAKLVATVPRSEQVEEALSRLLNHLASTARAELFAKSAVRELYLALLSTQQGDLLRWLLHDKKVARIAKALEHVHTNFHTVIAIGELAEIAHMSEPSFYRASEYTTQGKMTSLFGLESDRFGQVRRQA